RLRALQRTLPHVGGEGSHRRRLPRAVAPDRRRRRLSQQHREPVGEQPRVRRATRPQPRVQSPSPGRESAPGKVEEGGRTLAQDSGEVIQGGYGVRPVRASTAPASVPGSVPPSSTRPPGDGRPASASGIPPFPRPEEPPGRPSGAAPTQGEGGRSGTRTPQRPQALDVAVGPHGGERQEPEDDRGQNPPAAEGDVV